MPTTTTTRDIAARLVPLLAPEWPALFERFPNGRPVGSQLEHCLEGYWYRHEGTLTLGGDYEHTVNLVVDGDLTVEGTIDDSADQAILVVLGDVRCANLLSRHLIVIAGSLYCGGLVHAHYNDWTFEVWGKELAARSLVLTGRGSILPSDRATGHEYDSQSGDGPEPQEFETVRRKIRSGKAVRIRGKSPSIRAELRQSGCSARSLAKALADPSLHLDLAGSPAASPRSLTELSRSSDPKVLTAVAGHPQSPPRVLAALAQHSDPAVRAAVVHQPRLPRTAAMALAADSSVHVRTQFAAGPWSALAIGSLAADPHPRVRRAIASHSGLSVELRRSLLHDPDEAVARRALYYLPATPEWIAELLQSQREMLLAWALERSPSQAPHAPASSEHWQRLLDPRRKVREAALKQTPPDRALFAFLDEHRDTFVEDESPALRGALASASRDAATIAALALDGDEVVRRTALANLAAPESLLSRHAERLCSVPPGRWSAFDPGYMDHMRAVGELMMHPRLPAEAIAAIHRAYPRGILMDAHRNTPLTVIVERAEPWADPWKKHAEKRNRAKFPAIYTEMLDSGEKYLANAARSSPATPLKALLAHAQSCESDSAFEAIAGNPSLGAGTEDAAALIRLLLGRESHSILRALVRNPDLPADVLREIASLEPDLAEDAALAVWQLWGESL